MLLQNEMLPARQPAMSLQ